MSRFTQQQQTQTTLLQLLVLRQREFEGNAALTIIAIGTILVLPWLAIPWAIFKFFDNRTAINNEKARLKKIIDDIESGRVNDTRSFIHLRNAKRDLAAYG